MENKQTEEKKRDLTISTYKYAILMETNEEECESWMNFIRYQGNEETLKHLNTQLETVRWQLDDGLSTFDLEMEYLVSEQTAKEMSKVDLNHYSFHRKFDGTLKKIDLDLDRYKNNRKKMKAVFKVLGYGAVENYIDREDIDPEDMVNSDQDPEESSGSNSGSSSESSESPKHRKKAKQLPEFLKKKIKKEQEKAGVTRNGAEDEDLSSKGTRNEPKKHRR